MVEKQGREIKVKHGQKGCIPVFTSLVHGRIHAFVNIYTQ
jgi:hypothetical protein